MFDVPELPGIAGPLGVAGELDASEEFELAFPGPRGTTWEFVTFVLPGTLGKARELELPRTKKKNTINSRFAKNGNGTEMAWYWEMPEF